MPKLADFSILLAMLYKALAFFFLKEKDNLLLRNRTFSLRFSHKYDTVDAREISVNPPEGIV